MGPGGAGQASSRELFFETVRALCHARRAIPIALVVVPMVGLEALIGGARGLIFGCLLCLTALAIGPFAYRALLPAEGSRAHDGSPVLGFAAIDFGWVALMVGALPRALGATQSILSDAFGLAAAPAMFWAGSWALGRDIDWEHSLRRARERETALAREAERAQLVALRNHLDPHFLFNTLNAIAEWCRADPRVAERATLQLSSMLRTILSGVKAAAWPLEREVELIRQLLELYAARDPQRFASAIEVEPDALQVPIPPLLLLSLVENAIKHGPAAGHAGVIKVSACRSGERLQICIHNPGAFRGPRPGGEGLAVLEKRLRLAYDQAASMTHTSDGSTTRACLLIPLSPRGDGA